MLQSSLVEDVGDDDLPEFLDNDCLELICPVCPSPGYVGPPWFPGGPDPGYAGLFSWFT